MQEAVCSKYRCGLFFHFIFRFIIARILVECRSYKIRLVITYMHNYHHDHHLLSAIPFTDLTHRSWYFKSSYITTSCKSSKS